MPELPEVETIKRGLEHQIVGKTVHGVITSPEDRYAGALAMSGKTVERLRRRGKFLIFDLGAEEMVVSLGMTGKLLLNNLTDKDKPYHLVTWMLSGNNFLRFVDVRKFGAIKSYHKGQYGGLLAELGPEPFSEEFQDTQRAHKFLQKSSRPIGATMLEQKFVAGLGTYLTSEILFRARINPNLPGQELSASGAARLIKSTLEVIEKSIEHGGNSFSDYVDSEGKSGKFNQYLKVYGHEGKGCQFCGETIQKKVLAGRGVHFCQRCQGER